MSYETPLLCGPLVRSNTKPVPTIEILPCGMEWAGSIEQPVLITRQSLSNRGIANIRQWWRTSSIGPQ